MPICNHCLYNSLQKSFLVQPRHPAATTSLSSPASTSSPTSVSTSASPATAPISSGAKDPHQHLLQAGCGSVHQLAQSGVGLWVALKNSATICLYHTETFRHLQDINIASNVSRVLAARDVSQPQRSIHVTALMASRGLLWVGTNVGIALTVPLPRLEGVPIISGRANISYHAHFGPVTFFLNLQPRVVADTPQAPPMATPLCAATAQQSAAAIREEPEREEAPVSLPPHQQTPDSPHHQQLSGPSSVPCVSRLLKKQSSEGSIGSPAGSSDKVNN